MGILTISGGPRGAAFAKERVARGMRLFNRLRFSAFLVCASVAFVLCPSAQGKVGVYEARVDGAQAPVQISCRLNSPADVTINIRDASTGALVRTLGPIQAEAAGLYTAACDDTLPQGMYYGEIVAAGRPVTAFTPIIGPLSGTPGNDYVTRRWYGIAVNHNPDSPYYGYIYVPDKYSKRVSAFHPDGSFAFDFEKTGSFWGSSAPWGCWVDGQGLVYVGDRSGRKLHQFSADGKLLASGSSGSYVRGVTGRDTEEGTEIWVSSEAGMFRIMCTPGNIGPAAQAQKSGATLGAGLYGAAASADGTQVLTAEVTEGPPSSVKAWESSAGNLTYTGATGEGYRLDVKYGLEPGVVWTSGATLHKLVQGEEQPVEYQMPVGGCHMLAVDPKGNPVATYGMTSAPIAYPFFAVFAEPDPLDSGGHPIPSTDSIRSCSFGVGTDPWPLLLRYAFTPPAIPADGAVSTSLQVTLEDGTGADDIQSVKLDLTPVGGTLETLQKQSTVPELKQAVYGLSGIVCAPGTPVGKKYLRLILSDGKHTSEATVMLRVAGDGKVSGVLRNYYDRRAIAGPATVRLTGGPNPNVPLQYETQVGADGSFSVVVKEGKYSIWGEKAHYASGPVTKFVVDDAEIQQDACVSPVSVHLAAQEPDGLEIEVLGTVGAPAASGDSHGLQRQMYLRDSEDTSASGVMRVAGPAVGASYHALWQLVMGRGSFSTVNGVRVFNAVSLTDVGRGSFPVGQTIGPGEISSQTSGGMASMHGVRVTEVSTSGGYFTVADGSGAARVCLSSPSSTGIAMPPVGSLVSVMGIVDRTAGGVPALYPSLPEMVSVTPPDKAEFRAFWCDAFHDGFKTAAQVDQLVADAHQANANALIVQMRRRADTYYPSPYDPFAADADPNFDALAYLVQKAHAAVPPIEVHAWAATVPVWNGATPPSNSAHITNTHPEYLTRSVDGGLFDGSNLNLDPGHPGAQQYITDVYKDMVRRYDIDGIHFDMVRFASSDWGYNPTSVSRFNAAFGRTGTPATDDEDWLQWRRDQITAMVRRIYLETIAIKPGLKVSAATITWGDGPTWEEAWYSTSAYASVLQDWRAWMEEGILDINVPMTYYRDYSDTYAAYYNHWIDFEKNHRYGRHLAVGLGIYLNNIGGSISQIRRALLPGSESGPAEGTAVYSYAVPDNADSPQDVFFNSVTGLNPYDQAILPVWFDTVPTPAMPWKDAAVTNKGHLKGRVGLFDTGGAADGATVEVVGPEYRLLHTDVNGFFGTVGLAGGKYMLKVSAKGYAQQVGYATVLPARVASADFMLSTAVSRLVESIREAKAGTPGERLALLNKIATTSRTDWSQTMFISEPDRTTGIRLDFSSTTWPAVQEGDVVNVTGLVGTTPDGEPTLSSAQVAVVSHGTPLRPFVMPNSMLVRVLGAVPDPTELLVTAYGHVVEGDFNGWEITDGSLLAGTVLRVSAHGAGVPDVGSWVCVTGIAGLDRSTGTQRRIIRPRNELDLTVIAAP